MRISVPVHFIVMILVVQLRADLRGVYRLEGKAVYYKSGYSLNWLDEFGDGRDFSIASYRQLPQLDGSVVVSTLFHNNLRNIIVADKRSIMAVCDASRDQREGASR